MIVPLIGERALKRQRNVGVIDVENNVLSGRHE
jgi:hypothetical protein